MNKKDLQEKLEILQSNKQGIDNKIEKLKKEIEEYKPKSIYDFEKGDKYFTIYSSAHIEKNTFDNDSFNMCILKVGNAFLTYEEAEEELNYREAVARVKKWYYDNNAGVDMSKVDINKRKLICYIDISKNELLTYISFDCYMYKNKIVVKNEELAKKLMTAHSEDLKTILNHNQFKGF